MTDPGVDFFEIWHWPVFVTQPTRRDSDPNWLRYCSKEGGYDLGALSEGFCAGGLTDHLATHLWVLIVLDPVHIYLKDWKSLLDSMTAFLANTIDFFG